MLIKNIFIFFGIGLALLAVVVSIVGLRAKDFPSRKALLGIVAASVFLVFGTAGYAWALAEEEKKEREEHKGLAIGEEE